MCTCKEPTIFDEHIHFLPTKPCDNIISWITMVIFFLQRSIASSVSLVLLCNLFRFETLLKCSYQGTSTPAALWWFKMSVIRKKHDHKTCKEFFSWNIMLPSNIERVRLWITQWPLNLLKVSKKSFSLNHHSLVAAKTAGRTCSNLLRKAERSPRTWLSMSGRRRIFPIASSREIQSARLWKARRTTCRSLICVAKMITARLLKIGELSGRPFENSFAYLIPNLLD